MYSILEIVAETKLIYFTNIHVITVIIISIYIHQLNFLNAYTCENNIEYM